MKLYWTGFAGLEPEKWILIEELNRWTFKDNPQILSNVPLLDSTRVASTRLSSILSGGTTIKDMPYICSWIHFLHTHPDHHLNKSREMTHGARFADALRLRLSCVTAWGGLLRFVITACALLSPVTLQWTCPLVVCCYGVISFVRKRERRVYVLCILWVNICFSF